MKKVLLPILTVAFIFLAGFIADERRDGNVAIPAYKTAGDNVQLILPAELDDYEGIEVPQHYYETAAVFGTELMNVEGQGFENAGFFTNEGATLGRVLFYDRNLSINRTVSCGSCHGQTEGFAENKQVSEGFNGMLGTRNSLNIAEIGFSNYDKLFWDDREQNLEEMVLLPLQDGDEMGISMAQLLNRLENLEYYPPLFEMAFGTNEISEELVGSAMAQFIRTMLPLDSKLDQGIANNFVDFNDEELLGKTIFQQDCQSCHSSVVTTQDWATLEEEIFENADPDGNFPLFGTELMFMFLGPHNTGLDLEYADGGMSEWTGFQGDEGKFKTPNLKNVALSAPYMHDGRFADLEEVIEFYSEEVEGHPNSHFLENSFFYDVPDNLPDSFIGFEYTEEEKSALVAFMHTLTDESFINDSKWSDPFVYEDAVGVSELLDFGVEVFPNPVVETATVTFGADLENEVKQIRLLDLSGKVIWQDKTSGENYSFEKGSLSSGNYLIEIEAGTKRGAQKLSIL